MVDSFVLGLEDSDFLKTISVVTGVYAFEPSCLEEAMRICELEPILSISERPDSSIRHSPGDHSAKFQASPTLENLMLAREDVYTEYVTRDDFPERKVNPQLTANFIELGLFSSSSLSKRSDTNLRLSRIHNEIRNSGSTPHPHYDVYFCEPNFGLWKIVMQGTYRLGSLLGAILQLLVGTNPLPRAT